MGHYATGIRLCQILAGLLFIAVSGAVWAQETASLDIWQGYRATAEIALPFAAVAQTAAVQIEATYVRENETSLGALTTVLTAESPVVTDHALLDADSRLMQIETCRRQGLEVCPILTIHGSGSGFIDNGRNLYTCRHVVGDWPLAASLLNSVPLQDIIAPLIIRDRGGALLYNTAYSTNILRFDLLNDDPRLDEERILRYRALGSRSLPNPKVSFSETLQYLLKASDFLGMKADGDLIDPVPLERAPNIAPGDVFYLSGFPSDSQIAPAHIDGLPDRLLVSSVLKTKIYSSSLPLLMAEGLQRPGGSGGIVTNAAGAVIGMSCFADKANAYAFAFDAGAQEQFWGQLKSSQFKDVFVDLPVEAAARN